MNKIKTLFIKYKEIINYLIFGVLTTVINILVYDLFFYAFHLENIPSNVIAWVVSVLFAFITNKLFVFNSYKKGLSLIVEMISFFGCRLSTGLIDTGLMYLFIDVLKTGHNTIIKIIVNVIVIVLNYVLSKIIIFRRKKDE